MSVRHPVYRDLAVDTILAEVEPACRARPARIRVTSMRGELADVHRINKDGTPDRRYSGWFGHLLIGKWRIVPTLKAKERRR